MCKANVDKSMVFPLQIKHVHTCCNITIKQHVHVKDSATYVNMNFLYFLWHAFHTMDFSMGQLNITCACIVGNNSETQFTNN